MPDKPYAEAAARNSPAILEVLRREFCDRSRVLEIGSGTGQHAAHVARELRGLCWQTSDLDDNHAGILAWIADAGLDNVIAPLSLDVRTAELDAGTYDGVFSANTAHIMSREAVSRMFALVGKVLQPGGRFCLYGPFSVNGRFNSSSNAAFDAGLRARDPLMGIRDLCDLDRLATGHGLQRERLYAMPSNNHIAVWAKIPGRMQ